MEDMLQDPNYIAYQKLLCDESWVNARRGQWAIFCDGEFFDSSFDYSDLHDRAFVANPEVKTGFYTFEVDVHYSSNAGSPRASDDSPNYDQSRELFNILAQDIDWLNRYKGQFIAIVGGEVFGVNSNKEALELRARQQYPGSKVLISLIPNPASTLEMPALQLLSREVVWDSEYLGLRRTNYFDKQGSIRDYHWVHKNQDPIFVFPITSDRKVVLVSQFRIPVETRVIEPPAGLRDGKESDEEVARRELFEETGYIAQTLLPVRPWPYAPAMSDNLARGFIATGLTKTGKAGGDATEDLSVIEVPMDELVEFSKDPQNFPMRSEVFLLYHIALSMGL